MTCRTPSGRSEKAIQVSEERVLPVNFSLTVFLSLLSIGLLLSTHSSLGITFLLSFVS